MTNNATTLAQSLLQRLQQQNVLMPDGFITTERLAETLADFCRLYNVSPAQLIGTSRQHHLVEVRQLCWFLAYTRLRLTHTLIGRIFNRHHSTIISGIDRINQLMASEPVLRDHVSNLDLWVNITQHANMETMVMEQETGETTDQPPFAS